MQENILETHYKNLLSELPTSARLPSKKSPPYIFNTDNIPVFKPEFITNEISIIKRQLYKPNALQDNIIIRASKLSARSLALQIISVFLSNGNESSNIQLSNPSSEVKVITINKPDQRKSRLCHQLQRFTYRPQNLDEFDPGFISQQDEYEVNHCIEFILVNSKNYISDSFINKNNLIITGSCAGMILLAESLLNLGLDSSITNYINFEHKPIDIIDINVSKNSCSGRIEIITADCNSL